MISRQRIIAITDSITAGLMNGQEEGGEAEVNKALQFLLRNTVLQLAFIESSARTGEYDAWLKRVNQKIPGIKEEINKRMFVVSEEDECQLVQ